MTVKNILLIAAASLALTSCHTTRKAVAYEGKPQYVFYFIGDGMGMGPAMAAQMYNTQVLDNGPLTMYTFPTAGMAMTYSASSPVTDSAAAGTALASGSKTRNGMLGMDADTVSVTSVARILKDDGYGVGIITTVAPDDATPGAFYAHVPSRKMFYEIGCQAAGSGYEFIAGAGLRGLTDKEGKATDLLEVMAANDVKVVHGYKELAGTVAEKVFLVNNEGTDPNNVGYTIDSIADNLTLPLMTQACLSHLERYTPDRFFMMVEGGNIDHALHANDGGTAVIEILNFDQAIKIAYDFYLTHPDKTLIVVTADHDTGGMSIGSKTTGYNAHLDMINSQKVSKEAFNDYCYGILKSRRVYTWDDMKEYLSDNFGFWSKVPLTDAQTAKLQEKFDNTFTLRNSEDQQTLYANFNSFAAEVFNLFNEKAGMGFITTSHTGNPVPVFAIGVGAERFSHLNNNIDIPATILQLTK